MLAVLLSALALTTLPLDAAHRDVAAAVSRDGAVLLLAAPVLSAAAPPAAAAVAALSGLLSEVEAVLPDYERRQFSFLEVCHRSPCRYDVALSSLAAEETTAWAALDAAVDKLVLPVLEHLDDGPLWSSAAASSGVVVSQPGARHQSYHADGDKEGLLNAFVPLVDVPARTHGTEFWLGSHLEPHAASLAATLQYDEDVETVAPAMRRGDLLLFDYRTIHRGRAHPARLAAPRPVFYRTFSRVEDEWNFPSRSLR